jgi:ubiquinone/menaquinone biosynthesis C-methylase UbiE
MDILDYIKTSSFQNKNGIIDCVDFKLESEQVSKTAAQFSYEFVEVPDRVDLVSKKNEDTTLFLFKTGINPDFLTKNNNLDQRLLQDINALNHKGDFSFLNDKIVIDAGCGNGRFAEIVAPHCKHLICLDLGEHIFYAKNRLKEFSNVSYVRCNLLDIPLTSEMADYIYSIGVIHHTPDPKKSLKELTRILKKEGSISIWVYPTAYWGNKIKKTTSLFIRNYLLKRELSDQISFIKKILLPIGRLQMFFEKYYLKYLFFPIYIINVPRHEDQGEMLATTIDYFLPQYINTYNDSGLEEMFKQAGLTYKKLPFETSAIGKKP